jgi:hypothetical protein
MCLQFLASPDARPLFAHPVFVALMVQRLLIRWLHMRLVLGVASQVPITVGQGIPGTYVLPHHIHNKWPAVPHKIEGLCAQPQLNGTEHVLLTIMSLVLYHSQPHICRLLITFQLVCLKIFHMGRVKTVAFRRALPA